MVVVVIVRNNCNILLVTSRQGFCRWTNAILEGVFLFSTPHRRKSIFTSSLTWVWHRGSGHSHQKLTKNLESVRVYYCIASGLGIYVGKWFFVLLPSCVDLTVQVKHVLTHINTLTGRLFAEGRRQLKLMLNESSVEYSSVEYSSVEWDSVSFRSSLLHVRSLFGGRFDFCL